MTNKLLQRIPSFQQLLKLLQLTMFLGYKILQPHSFINTSTNPDGSHMYNYIRQIEVNMADEPLKVEQPLLERVK